MRDASFVAVIDETMIEKQDGGQSLSVELANDDTNLFVRIQSWDEYGSHQAFNSLIGRRIRVVIEDATDETT